LSEKDEKTVDEDWKKQARAEKEAMDAAAGSDRTTSEAPIGELPPVTFSIFVQSLATQVLIQLGVIPNPFSGKSEKNPDRAKYTIDILGMLEEKTRGNLSDEESSALDQILYDLRMRFVEAGNDPRSN